jgi:hypothetical protein
VHPEDGRGRWKALIPLGLAQFLVVLDTSVMNVSISPSSSPVSHHRSMRTRSR